MKLQRQSIKLGSEYRGKWNFCICDKNPEELERVEESTVPNGSSIHYGW